MQRSKVYPAYRAPAPLFQRCQPFSCYFNIWQKDDRQLRGEVHETRESAEIAQLGPSPGGARVVYRIRVKAKRQSVKGDAVRLLI